MASGTFYPAVSGDDGFRGSVSGFNNSAQFIYFGEFGETANGFVRFVNVTIPQGSTITNAYIRFTSYNSESGTAVNTNVYFNNVDDATAPTNATEFDGLSLTSGVAWDGIAAWSDGSQYDTVDIKSALQTVIDRVGWASGQAVTAVIKDDSSDSGAIRRPSQIDWNSGAEKAELHVEWSEDVDVLATTATLTITANAATISNDIDVTANTDTLTITANAAQVGYGTSVSASSVSLTLTENAASVISNVNLAANTTTLTLATQQADVNLNVSVTATTAALTLATNAADIEVDVVNVWGTTAALTSSANAASIKYDIPVSATTHALTLASYDATIWDGAAWSAWIAENNGKFSRKFIFTLTGDGETPAVSDVEIPISSFQCRRRADSPTYLSVVIPGTAYSSQITARSNGDLKLEMAYILAGSIAYQSTIALVDLDEIQVDEGGGSSAITLIGYRTASYTPKTIELRDIIYSRLRAGKYTYRCSNPDLYLHPGDTASADGNTFTVDEIQYVVSPQLQMMEVKET